MQMNWEGKNVNETKWGVAISTWYISKVHSLKTEWMLEDGCDLGWTVAETSAWNI